MVFDGILLYFMVLGPGRTSAGLAQVDCREDTVLMDDLLTLCFVALS